MNSQKKKVLLVEDDTNLGNLLQDALDDKNFEVVLKRNGEDGFHEFKANRFDICILDVMMPKKDGFTLASEIRKMNSQIPIIFLTAKAMKGDREKCIEAGASDYITKPVDPDQLISLMRVWLYG